MIIIEVKNGESLDKALKQLKSKVIKTKQNQLLIKKKEYIKKSVRRRNEIQKAIYTQQKKNSN
jgi:small subunit ribosomal protein S21